MAGIAKRIGVVVMAALLLPGCAVYSLQELRQVTPKGTLFQNALARLYMDFAGQEEKEYDWFNSWHFADKGLMLAYGKDMGPEDLADWDIPADALPYLQNARASLMAVLTPQNEQANPDVAAKAQYNFDCWVEQQEENWQMDDIAACRDGLRDALAELGAPPVALTAADEHTMPPPEEMAPPHKMKQAKKAPVKKRHEAHAAKMEEIVRPEVVEPETTSYVVFFEANTAELSPSGKKVVEDVAHSLAGAKDYDIVINGNTSTSGGVDSKLRLSQARIGVVRAALIEAGIPESVINTGGSVKQAANRRVEIFLNE